MKEFEKFLENWMKPTDEDLINDKEPEDSEDERIRNLLEAGWRNALQWVLNSHTEVHDGDNFENSHIYQMIERELGEDDV